ncbi:metallophosphoesterase [Advenella kashmirensis]
MTTFHRTLPANTTGRDFVVGDLHGCLDLLENALERQGFDKQFDRLLSVGDLIDRGPDSLGCLRLLREAWFHAVVGNHEDMLLSYLSLRDSDYHPPRAILNNGGQWIARLTPDEHNELHQDLLPRLLTLPYVITVDNGLSTFHVAHAELPLADKDLSESRLSHMAAALTWSRLLISGARSDLWHKRQTSLGTLATSPKPWKTGMALRFVGHTPLPNLVMHRSHLFIDGGAFLREESTCLHVIEVAHAQRLLLND